MSFDAVITADPSDVIDAAHEKMRQEAAPRGASLAELVALMHERRSVVDAQFALHVPEVDNALTALRHLSVYASDYRDSTDEILTGPLAFPADEIGEAFERTRVIAERLLARVAISRRAAWNAERWVAHRIISDAFPDAATVDVDSVDPLSVTVFGVMEDVLTTGAEAKPLIERLVAALGDEDTVVNAIHGSGNVVARA
jgi:hypothetical protein